VNTTVIYYTSNTELPAFEEKIRQALMEAKGDLPLISVSQKPIDFGQNICVGDVGPSSQNAYRQLLIGVEAATTEFVCTAESDFLYDPAYFQFQPKNNTTFYLAKPCWVLHCLNNRHHVFGMKNDFADAPLMVGRKTLSERITVILDGMSEWGAEHPDPMIWPYLLDRKDVTIEMFDAGRGSISFKTNENMHRASRWLKETKCRQVDGWGTAHELINKYYRCLS